MRAADLNTAHRRTLFLYPGQGAQHVGMGDFLKDAYPQCRDMFARADQVLGFPLSRICLRGTGKEIDRDLTAQLAVYVVSCMVTDVLGDHSVTPDVLSGYSSGFYAAAYAAGCYTFEEGLRVVRRAGEILLETASRQAGGMGVVFGLPADEVRQICRDAGRVEAVIFNTPRQIIVSGERGRVASALALCREKGALDVYALPAEAAYHSSFMAEATRRFLKEVNPSWFRDPVVPLYSYANMKVLRTGEQVMTAMGRQLSRPVRWVDLIGLFRDMHISRWVEAGPGTVISRTVRWIDRHIDIHHTAKQRALRGVIETYGEERKG